MWQTRHIILTFLISTFLLGCGVLHGPNYMSGSILPNLILWVETVPDSIMPRDTAVYDGINLFAAQEPSGITYWRVDYLGSDSRWYVKKEGIAVEGEIAGSTWILFDEETVPLRFVVWVKNKWDRVIVSDTLYYTHLGKGMDTIDDKGLFSGWNSRFIR